MSAAWGLIRFAVVAVACSFVFSQTTVAAPKGGVPRPEVRTPPPRPPEPPRPRPPEVSRQREATPSFVPRQSNAPRVERAVERRRNGKAPEPVSGLGGSGRVDPARRERANVDSQRATKDIGRGKLDVTGRDRVGVEKTRSGRNDAISRIEGKQRQIETRNRTAEFAGKERKSSELDRKGSETKQGLEKGRDVTNREAKSNQIERQRSDLTKSAEKTRLAEGKEVKGKEKDTKSREQSKASDPRRIAEGKGKEARSERQTESARERIGSIGKQMETRRREAVEKRGNDTIAKLEAKGRSENAAEAKRSQAELVNRRAEARSERQVALERRRLSERTRTTEKTLAHERNARTESMRAERGMELELRERKELAHGHSVLPHSHMSQENGMAQRAGVDRNSSSSYNETKGGEAKDLNLPGGRDTSHLERVFYVTPKGVTITSDTLAVQGTSRKVGNFTDLRGATINEIVSRIPKTWTWGPQRRGQGIVWYNSTGAEAIRLHAPSTNAPEGSNSASGWVLRIHAPDGKYFDANGKLVEAKDNEGHIPIYGNPNARN